MNDTYLSCPSTGSLARARGGIRAGLLLLASWTAGVLATPSHASQSSAPPEPPGPVRPELLKTWAEVLPQRSVDWMERERLQLFGWANLGYTWSDLGSGPLRVAPRANRFSDEFLLNQAAIVVERGLDPHAWSVGFRTEFYCGADAALMRPLGGFGPDDNPRFGTDLRQLHLSAHLPVLTDGGIDLRLGRVYVPIGYESTMSPYRPMYSAAYIWFYSQTGAATGGTATWHVNPRLDLIAGVTLGFNTFFELRGDEPCYVVRAIHWLQAERRTRLVATAYTGPQPIATSRGHLAEWQTVLEGQVVHDWSPRLTTVLELNIGWDRDQPATGGTSEWYGGYLLGIAHLHRQWDAHLRAEGFGDMDGSRTGIAATYTEVAAGLNFMPRRWLNFRPEARWDFADTAVFSPTRDASPDSRQFTLAVDCVVKF